MNKSAEQYFIDGCGRCSLGGTPDCKVNRWQTVLGSVREILKSTDLVEERKWGCPCYTMNGKNILMLSCFKEKVILSFFDGALLQDKGQLLQFAGPNSRTSKQFEFTQIDEVEKHRIDILKYISEAIDLKSKPTKHQKKQQTNTDLPEELQRAFNEDPAFQAAFEALTPGRQRGYIIHFTQAKQASTREKRIEKARPDIMQGLGIHDHYKASKKS